MKRLRLSPAQVSALECAGLDMPLDDREQVLADAWKGDHLEFDPEDRELIWELLNAASNSEDEIHQNANLEPDARKYAGRAARSLAALGSKVLRG